MKRIIVAYIMTSFMLCGIAHAVDSSMRSVAFKTEDQLASEELAHKYTYLAQASPSYPDLFTTQYACEKAEAEGKFTVYKPRFTKDAGKEDPSTYEVRPTERYMCYKMNVVGPQDMYAVAPPGTLLRHRKVNGKVSEVPHALHSCGNQIYTVVYLDPPRFQSAVEASREYTTGGAAIGAALGASRDEPVVKGKESAKSDRFWCFQSLGKGLVCAIVLVGAGYGLAQLGDDDGRPPGGTIDGGTSPDGTIDGGFSPGGTLD